MNGGISILDEADEAALLAPTGSIGAQIEELSSHMTRRWREDFERTYLSRFQLNELLAKT
jgi:hypothetical protein